MITINYSYYNNLDLFKWIRDYYLALDTNNFHFTIVDDGSKDIPLPISEVPKDWSIYKITEDIGWNANGVRNLLMSQTTTKWNINIDLDRVIAPQTLQYIRTTKLTENTIHHFSVLPHHSIATSSDIIHDYTWQQKEKDKNSKFKCAFNNYMITKDTFWNIGTGYAEKAHGKEYGGDYILLDKFKPWNMNPNLYIFDVVFHATHSKEWKQQSIDKWGRYTPGEDNGKRIDYPWVKIR